MQRWLLLATASASMWRRQSRKTPVCLRLRRQSVALKKQYIIFLQLGPLSPLATPSWLSLVWVHLCAAGLWLHSPLSLCVCVCAVFVGWPVTSEKLALLWFICLPAISPRMRERRRRGQRRFPASVSPAKGGAIDVSCRAVYRKNQHAPLIF